MTRARRCCRCGRCIDRELLTAKVCTACLQPAVREYKRRQRAGNIRPSVRRAVLERDGMICRYCGRTVSECRDSANTLELDHVIAVRDGGASTADNLVVSCRR